MKSAATIVLLGALFVAASALAADPVVGHWKLNVAMSKFAGAAPKSGTAVYAETDEGTSLEQTMLTSDGRELIMHLTLRYDGADHPITGNPDADRAAAHVINERTVHLTLKLGSKVVGSVHRVISPDGHTLTVNDKGIHRDGKGYNETLVFDRQ
jgi:hypothetical protein